MPRLVESSLVPFSPNSLAPPHHLTRDSASSVKLSCLSPNGRAVHSLSFVNGVAYIETHSLPLPGTLEEPNNEINDLDIPAVVSTLLPERIQASINRYQPLELLCVDVDSPTPSSSNNRGIQKIPLLCLYTAKEVFLLELAYTLSGHREVQGIVECVTEPFDDVLLGTSTSTSIVKIRPAPQRRFGNVAMCPPGSMAALTHNSTTNEYALVLYQGNDDLATPLVYGMEQLEEQDERITDFCFCQSNAFSLLSSLSVLFLKGTGDALLATPILFRGTVVPRESVAHTLTYLDARLNQMDSSTAAWRQYRTAKQFLIDGFPDDGRSHYVTAQVRSEALQWPVQMQGPVLVAAESDMFMTLAAAIEPVAAGDLAGVGIGHLGNVVDFGLLSPSTFIPRFKLERDEDTYQLDNDLKWGTIVQRVDLGNEGNEHQPLISSLALIQDPVLDTVVHYVTASDIKSICSNSIKITTKKVAENTRRSAFPSSNELVPKTTAWSSLDSSILRSERISISGVVVTSDAHLGHVLVARLSNGSMVPVNLTETRHFHEMEALSETDQSLARAKSASASDQALVAMQGTAPLHEVMGPLLQKVTTGLGGMGKFVGTATSSKAITPDLLAVAVSVKERCENEVFLPLLEMNEVIDARRKDLETMYKNQINQLVTLRETIKVLNKRMAMIREKAEEARTNATSLAHRSSKVLQSSSDMLPTITQSEFDYFQELKRLDAKTTSWKEEFDRLSRKTSNIREAIETGRVGEPLKMPAESLLNCNRVLKASSLMLKKQADRLNETGNTLNEVSIVIGLDDVENEKTISAGQ